MKKAESRMQKPAARSIATEHRQYSSGSNRKSQIANRKSKLPWLLALALMLATAATYWPATRGDFVNYDDDLHVTANLQVQKGLTWESVKWAAFNPVNSIWHPLTVWSHMADCQFYGLNPWGHHLTSVLLHALNAGLVFVLLRLLTGATGRSLTVAALFALHPLRVESVAWVSERKDVLSGFFGLLSLIAYARYAQGRRWKAEARKPKPEGNPKSEARNPKAGARGSSLPSFISYLLSPIFYLPSSLFYLLSLCFLALGLMSKPILVTWPFVMLLLDYWPLGRMPKRMQNAAASDTHHATRTTPDVSGLTPQSPIANRQSQIIFPLLLEKLPFFVLAALMSVVTFVVQRRTGALAANESLPLSARGGNALISYCRYLGKLCWPTDLAVVYPHPGQWPLVLVVLAGGLLLGITALVWAGRRRHPYLLVGWLWYCGTLVPVSQLVQTGGHAIADRYTYLPSLGALILLIWGACELVQGKTEGRRQKTEDRGQTTDDSDTRHATRDTQHVSPTRLQSPIASRKSQILLWVAGGAAILLCLALTRQQIGYWRDSEALFQHALEVTENNALAHNNLGAALGKKGQTDEAIREYLEALRLKPGYAQAHNNLGAALARQGQIDEAIAQYLEAVRLDPNYGQAHFDFGIALERKGQTGEAMRQYEEAIRLMPDNADAHNNLGAMLDEQGQTDQAIRQYQEVLRLKPDHADAHHNLGVALGRLGQTDEAIRHLQEAIRLKPDDGDAHYNLGIALARKGQMDEAIRQYQEAIRLKPDNADARNGLGAVLVGINQIDEAIRQFQEVLRLKPDDAVGHYNLGVAFYHRGRTDEAIRQFQEVIRLKPEHAEAHNNLGTALGLKGQNDESIRQFQEALRLRPDYAEARKNLAVALTARGDAVPPPSPATNR